MSALKIFIANTDPTWYQFLAQHDVTGEVNFWRPSGRRTAFRAIAPGELFFFRLGKPFHKIVGFGSFTHHSVLPLLMAWEIFGEANGAATLPKFIELIAKHRREKERSGQGAFRVMVLDAYNRRCCVTGERTLPVIEAAHIQQYVSPESNHVQNGLALREDVHTLFDEGYVAVDEDYRFVVSPRLREDYENGREYQRFQGKTILLPGRPQLTPSKDAIRWHLENVYIG